MSACLVFRQVCCLPVTSANLEYRNMNAMRSFVIDLVKLNEFHCIWFIVSPHNLFPA